MDYVSSGIDKLVSQFNGSARLKEFLSAFLREIQSIDDTLQKVKAQRWIETAYGVQLDGCGFIVGVDRYGMADEEYRQAIKSRVGATAALGTPKAVQGLLKFLSKADGIQYQEHYPATSIVLTEGYGANSKLPASIESVAPAGISDIPVMVTFGEKPLRTILPAEVRAVMEINGNPLSVSDGKMLDLGRAAKSQSSGARLSGLVSPRLSVNGKPLITSANKKVCISGTQEDKILDNGYHLTGVFQ